MEGAALGDMAGKIDQPTVASVKEEEEPGTEIQQNVMMLKLP